MMINLTIALMAFTIGVGSQRVFVAVAKTSSLSQGQSSPRGPLDSLVERAKASGQHEISFPTGVINDYGVARDVDEALSWFDVVVATVVYKKSFVDESDQIRTWFKFKIIENLHKSNRKCTSCQSTLNLPVEMPPPSDDEFLVLKDGGTVNIKGIRVTSYDSAFPDLSMSARYMLFISPNPDERNNALRMGPLGVYKIDSNDEIEPLRKDHSLSQDVKARLGDSMSRVRANLRSRVTPQ